LQKSLAVVVAPRQRPECCLVAVVASLPDALVALQRPECSLVAVVAPLPDDLVASVVASQPP
jgi:hypothetical protein